MAQWNSPYVKTLGYRPLRCFKVPKLSTKMISRSFEFLDNILGQLAIAFLLRSHRSVAPCTGSRYLHYWQNSTSDDDEALEALTP